MTGAFFFVPAISFAQADSLLRPVNQKISDSHSDGYRDLNVYWVGHSLMEHVADTSFGRVSVLDLVGIFAESDGHGYAKGDHTLWGAPLSLQWSGKAHGTRRTDPERVALREGFERAAGTYDAVVLTDTVPIGSAMKYEYSAYYLRKFYCAYANTNPNGAVYLYEGWINLQSINSDQSSILSRQQWRSRMEEDRSKWYALAGNAQNGIVTNPDLWRRGLSLFGLGSGEDCSSGPGITVLPVGTALLALHDWLNDNAGADSVVKSDGLPLLFTDLIANPYLQWPDTIEASGAGGSVQSESGQDGAGRELKHPEQEFDDIHPSGIGVYFNSLVTYAMLYRTTPEGLPALAELGDSLSRALQSIAWDTVNTELQRQKRSSADTPTL